MNSVAVLDNASRASFWRFVFGGSVDFARRAIMVLGIASSCMDDKL